MKRTLPLMLLLVAIFLAGCSENEETKVSSKPEKIIQAAGKSNSWELSTEFKSTEGDYLLGEEGKVGLIGPNFESGKVNKWLWHFWGDEKTIEGGNFQVVAIHKETGEKEMALVENAGAQNVKKVWSYGELSYSPNGVRGSDSSMPSNMSLSKPGIWRLEISIGNTYFGEIVVDVK
ncbi:hypothetical protein [Bacillus sp. B-jedd]|uniref:hypothetical protein n=1 Tax=Bacillus sp. B-jedd TaxID=1476857 RepID=UPI00051561FE|nr:hypothetical protein [Bacillus sp. B-jedd]CEG25668.1 lipoprotein [Bacillus sp. B-jedd]